MKNCELQTQNRLPLVANEGQGEIGDRSINYTHDNPVRALIVAEPQEYLFSSACDFAGEKGYVNVQTEI